MVQRHLEHNEVHGHIRTRRGAAAPGRRRGRRSDIDVQGARDIRLYYPDAVAIFTFPPPRGPERRLVARGLDGAESVRKRLINAAKEVEQAAEFQYVIVNDDLDRATLELQSLVRARRLTPARQAARLERIRKEFH